MTSFETLFWPPRTWTRAEDCPMTSPARTSHRYLRGYLPMMGFFNKRIGEPLYTTGQFNPFTGHRGISKSKWHHASQMEIMLRRSLRTRTTPSDYCTAFNNTSRQGTRYTLPSSSVGSARILLRSRNAPSPRPLRIAHISITIAPSTQRWRPARNP
jgi:hypothetical protein